MLMLFKRIETANNFNQHNGGEGTPLRKQWACMGRSGENTVCDNVRSSPLTDKPGVPFVA
jgi:hypothetical protein